MELLSALTFQSGYNAALVTIGAALFGIAAGAIGTFLYLRKRALVSDAVAHATLPGIALAFMAMVALGGDGRSLLGLMAGSAATAFVGLLAVDWITRRTRLSEDAAIGAVLSVFFGFGVVCLTVVQSLSAGRQAGLEGFLLGSTAGMLYGDAMVIVVSGALALAAVLLLRRPMTMIAFDAEFAAAHGVPVRLVDLAMMTLVMAVVVIGLKLVGLILVVALLIIPPVAARFWSDRTDRVALLAALFGGASGFFGAALSATAPALPTGSLIVLTAFVIFAVSLLASPLRGVLAVALRRRAFAVRVHRRQGLLALAHHEPIFDGLTLRVLTRERLIRPDGVPTEEGRREAAKARLDEARWTVARQIHQDMALAGRYDGLTPIETVFTPDEVAEFDRRLGPPSVVA